MIEPMQLTSTEQQYFRHPRQWQGGPTYDLTVGFNRPVTTSEIQQALAKIPESLLWQLDTDDRSMYLIRNPTFLQTPVGFFYHGYPQYWPTEIEFSSPSTLEVSYPCPYFMWVIYPAQIWDLCASTADFYPLEEVQQEQFVKLHQLLLWFVQQLAQHLPVKGATLWSEEAGEYFFADHLVMPWVLVEHFRLAGEQIDPGFCAKIPLPLPPAQLQRIDESNVLGPA